MKSVLYGLNQIRSGVEKNQKGSTVKNGTFNEVTIRQPRGTNCRERHLESTFSDIRCHLEVYLELR